MPIQIQFPAVAISPAGWIKAGNCLEKLTDAAPGDSLEEWQGLRIFDAARNTYRATRVERQWPASRLGLVLCRLTNQTTYVRFELQPADPVSVPELAAMLNHSEALPQGAKWSTQRDLVEFVCR